MRDGADRLWYPIEAPPRIGLPQPIRQLFDRLRAAVAWVKIRRMARKVQCVLLKKEADGLDYLPYPGELGKRIYDNISKEAWAQWVAHQTMLINENRLTPIEPKARAFLVAEMEKFLFGAGSQKPPDFVPK